MKHIFKKHHNPDLDWSTLETSEEDSTQLINAIADGHRAIAVYQPGADISDTVNDDDSVTLDPMELFSAPVRPHLLHESS